MSYWILFVYWLLVRRFLDRDYACLLRPDDSSWILSYMLVFSPWDLLCSSGCIPCPSAWVPTHQLFMLIHEMNSIRCDGRFSYVFSIPNFLYCNLIGQPAGKDLWPSAVGALSHAYAFDACLPRMLQSLRMWCITEVASKIPWDGLGFFSATYNMIASADQCWLVHLICKHVCLLAGRYIQARSIHMMDLFLLAAATSTLDVCDLIYMLQPSILIYMISIYLNTWSILVFLPVIILDYDCHTQSARWMISRFVLNTVLYNLY